MDRSLPLIAASIVKTFEERYCDRHRCTPAQFQRHLFWSSLHRHALLFAPLFLVGFFAPDMKLIADCGRVRGMRQLVQELAERRQCRKTHSFCARAGLRISERRLLRLARDYLPGSGLPPPF